MNHRFLSSERALCASVLAAMLALPSASAHAQCPKDAVGCADDGVMFMWSDSLFDTIDLDSGWVPAGSPLQIRLGFHLAGETQIDMMGTNFTFWQPALSVLPVGMRGGGRVSVDYGLEITARIRFDVTVAGVRYTWEGDIPIPGGIPRDLRVADETFFDPFVLPGADPRPIDLMDTTDTIEVVSLSLGSLIPVPGVDGGFSLGVFGALDAGYAGERIDVIRREVPGNPAVATAEEGVAAMVPAPSATGYGAAEDIAIDPVGTITYDGAIVAEPTFYIEVLGSRFDFTIATLRIPIVDTDSSPDFVPAEVHVPLPDIALGATSIDFGAIDVGERGQDTVLIRNLGEAELVVTPRAPAAPFVAATDPIVLAPGSERPLAVAFEPTEPGAFNVLLALDTNDPDRPVVTVRLNGTANEIVGPPDAGPGDAGPRTSPGISGGACGCAAVGASQRTGRAMVVMSLLGLAIAIARLRRG